MNDNLAEFRRRHWPRECFPARASEAEIYNFVLWRYIGVQRARWAADRRALRPALALRFTVRARWCALALHTVGRLLRLTLILDGTWPTRTRVMRCFRFLRGGTSRNP